MEDSSPSNETLHLVFVPMLAPGHFIPMIDMAKLMANHGGITATVFITPVIAARYGQTINQLSESISICFIQVPFPSKENGLPENCETADKLSKGQWINFFQALDEWQTSVEHVVEQMKPFPTCMITDRFIPKIAVAAKRLDIRRVIFDGMGCLSVILIHQTEVSGILESDVELEQPFIVPGIPDRIVITKQQLPVFVYSNSPGMKEYKEKLKEANRDAYGIIINSFDELELDYIHELQKLHQNRAWCVGPLCMSNNKSEMASRGDKASIDKNQCLKWLDGHESGSVIYVCLGSLSKMTLTQMLELGLALEASNRPFIWVIRETDGKEEIEKWLSDYEYEDRICGRGILVRGWAPQVLILSHESVGGFLTHCGWNSTIEGISFGVPMITWPLFSEQFFNEKLVVQILGIGVGVGAKMSIFESDEQKETLDYVLVRREAILDAIEKVMCGDDDGEERRKRARKLGEAAKKATEEGGSSYHNINDFLQDIVKPQ
ncbi:UDP-glycosyltransferase 73C4-like [Impatiens glandulifera]|uniref:UDP-glycosyltransferase 73C4-like n=1 Tax=Impatiens glandulifera TaxID=253017 RepID=UPI001FB10A18|nr:UDP-glycosyltransferase 73C4-like [Impatiens glandulifera]